MWPYLCPADAQISCHAFPLCFFLLPLSPPLSLYLSLFILSFFKLLYLSFQACLDNCVVTLHSPFFLSIIHHCGQQLRPVVHRQPAHISSHATAHIARPAPAPAPILLPLGTSNPPHPSLPTPPSGSTGVLPRHQLDLTYSAPKRLFICQSAAPVRFNAKICLNALYFHYLL